MRVTIVHPKTFLVFPRIPRVSWKHTVGWSAGTQTRLWNIHHDVGVIKNHTNLIGVSCQFE